MAGVEKLLTCMLGRMCVRSSAGSCFSDRSYWSLATAMAFNKTHTYTRIYTHGHTTHTHTHSGRQTAAPDRHVLLLTRKLIHCRYAVIYLVIVVTEYT